MGKRDYIFHVGIVVILTAGIAGISFYLYSRRIGHELKNNLKDLASLDSSLSREQDSLQALMAESAGTADATDTLVKDPPASVRPVDKELEAVRATMIALDHKIDQIKIQPVRIEPAAATPAAPDNADNSALVRERDEALDKAESLQAELARLRQTLADYAAGQNNTGDVALRYEKLKGELKELAQILAQRDKALQSKDAEAAALKNEITLLKSRAATLEESLFQVRSDNSVMADKIARLDKVNRMLQQYLKDLSGVLSAQSTMVDMEKNIAAGEAQKGKKVDVILEAPRAE